MHSPREEEGFALTERCTSRVVHDELRYQEEECLNFSGEGLLPGLTKVFRASRISHHHPVALS